MAQYSREGIEAATQEVEALASRMVLWGWGMCLVAAFLGHLAVTEILINFESGDRLGPLVLVLILITGAVVIVRSGMYRKNLRQRLAASNLLRDIACGNEDAVRLYATRWRVPWLSQLSQLSLKKMLLLIAGDLDWFLTFSEARSGKSPDTLAAVKNPLTQLGWICFLLYALIGLIKYGLQGRFAPEQDEALGTLLFVMSFPAFALTIGRTPIFGPRELVSYLRSTLSSDEELSDS